MTEADAIPIRAAVLEEFGGPIEIRDVLLDPPQAGEVLVRVAAAGVCHSDLHFAEGHLGRRRVPVVLGHEGAGVVEAVGEGVSHVAPGDHVTFCLVPPCGDCLPCRAGRGNLCERAGARAVEGTMLDGTFRFRLPDGRPLKHFNFISCFGDACVVPARSAVPVPVDLPLVEAALIGCAVVTGVGAVRNATRIRIGDSVCVIGCGGVGLQVLAAVRMAGAGRIIAVDRGPDKLEAAVARGATDTVDASAEDVVEAVRALSGGGVDHAIEVVGLPVTIRQAWDVLRPAGTAVVVGIAARGTELSIPALDLLSEKILRGSFYGSADPWVEIPVLAAMVASGRFPVADTVSHVTDLGDLQAAFERMRAGVGARTVMVIDPERAGTLRQSD